MAAAGMAAAAWGVAGVFVKLATMPALIITLYRLWFAVGLLLAASLVTGVRLQRRHLLAVVPGGLLLCTDMATYFSAVKLTSIADASVISALQPAFVLLAAGPLFSERVRRSDVVLAALAIAGVALVVVGGPSLPQAHDLSGDLLAVASLLAWSGYFLVSKQARSGMGALEYTLGVTLVAAIALSPIVLISGESWRIPTAADWGWITLLAVVPGTGHLAMNWAHRSIDVSVASLVGSCNPVFAAGAAWIALGQSLDATQVCGGLAGIAAVCAVASRRRVDVQSPVEPG